MQDTKSIVIPGFNLDFHLNAIFTFVVKRQLQVSR